MNWQFVSGVHATGS